MKTNTKISLALIGLCALARLVPHPWNLTPLVGIGLFSGAKASKARSAVLVTLAALLVSDVVLGFYRGMWYVYAAALIPVLIGRFVRRSESLATIAGGGLASSLSFFLVTNFMVWATGTLYPHTLAGLATCFVAAIPFYGNQLAGDAVYVTALFGGQALLQRFLEPRLRTA